MPAPGGAVRVRIETGGDDTLAEAVRQVAVSDERIEWLVEPTLQDPIDHVLQIAVEPSGHGATIRCSLGAGPPMIKRIAWYAVLPPLLAIVSAILFRRVVLCLVLGIGTAGVIEVWPTQHSLIAELWHAFYN